MRRALLLLALACAGCPGPEITPPREVLKAAREHAAAGRVDEAIEAYAAAFAEIAERTDTFADEARGEIHLELFKAGAHAKLDPARRARLAERVKALRDPGGTELLAEAIAQFAKVLSTSVEAEQHEACASAMAWVLRAKIDRKELRRPGPGENGFDELLYRRLLRQSIADYELFALVRGGKGRTAEPAATALDDLAKAFRELALFPKSLPLAAAHWDAQATEAEDRAKAVRRKPEEVKPDAQTRELVESDVDKQLDRAMAAHDLAVKRATSEESLALLIEAYEDALRHATLAREAVVEPNARQQNVFTTVQMDLDQLRRKTQK